MPDVGDEFGSMVMQSVTDPIKQLLLRPETYLNPIRSLLRGAAGLVKMAGGAVYNRAKAGESASSELKECMKKVGKEGENLTEDPINLGPPGSSGYKDENGYIHVRMDYSDNILDDGSKITDFKALEEDMKRELDTAGVEGMYDLSINEDGIADIMFKASDEPAMTSAISMMQDSFKHAEPEPGTRVLAISGKDLDKEIYDKISKTVNMEDLGMTLEDFRGGRAMEFIGGDSVELGLEVDAEEAFKKLKGAQLENYVQDLRAYCPDLKAYYDKEKDEYVFEYPSEIEGQLDEAIDATLKKYEKAKPDAKLKGSMLTNRRDVKESFNKKLEAARNAAKQNDKTMRMPRIDSEKTTKIPRVDGDPGTTKKMPKIKK